MLRSFVRPARRRWLLLAAVAMLASGCASVTSAGSTLPSGGDDDDAEVGPPQYGGRMVYGLEAETTNGWCLQEGQLAISGIQVARTIYDTLTVPDGDGGFRPTSPSRSSRTPTTPSGRSACVTAWCSTTAAR